MKKDFLDYPLQIVYPYFINILLIIYNTVSHVTTNDQSLFCMMKKEPSREDHRIGSYSLQPLGTCLQGDTTLSRE